MSNLHKRIRTKVRSNIQHGVDPDLDDIDTRVSEPDFNENRYEMSLEQKKLEKIKRSKEKAKKPHLRGDRVKRVEFDM